MQDTSNKNNPAGQPQKVEQTPLPSSPPAAPSNTVAPAEQNDDATWQYHNDQSDAAQPGDQAPLDASFSWSESEFVEHSKGASWYFLFGLVIIVIAGVIYLLTHSIFSTAVIILIGIIFAAGAGHKPKTVNYEINNGGVHFGQNFKSYDEFKSFSILDEGSLGSITLNPLRRFAAPLRIYYKLEDEEKIVEVLSDYLPHEETSKDTIDHLMHKIRF